MGWVVKREPAWFVVLQSGGAVTPHGERVCSAAASYQLIIRPRLFRRTASPAVRNIAPALEDGEQLRHLDLIGRLDRRFARGTADPQVDAAIRNYETAYRMQAAVPEACDVSGESAATRRLYGLDDAEPTKAAYARQCFWLAVWWSAVCASSN